MAPTRDPESGGRAGSRAARTFAAGIACGFVVGAFTLAVIVWQFGNVVGSRADSVRNPAEPPSPVSRWEDGLDDAGGIIERAENGAAGRSGASSDETRESTTAPPSAGPTIDVPSLTAPAESPRDLEERDLAIPVQGVRPEQLTRQFADQRGARRHQAIDILAPRNTPVLAIEDGRIARLFSSHAGGLTIYQFDPSERYCYYYAHLERYADGLQEGSAVRKGQVIGYVGTSGNAPRDTPHLHFAIFRLTEEKRWWEGTPVDPYDVLR